MTDMKTWDEIAMTAMVCALPSSDLENATTGKRTKKATLLQHYIAQELRKAYETGYDRAKTEDQCRI